MAGQCFVDPRRTAVKINFWRFDASESGPTGRQKSRTPKPHRRSLLKNRELALVDSTKNERCRGSAMLKRPFKSDHSVHPKPSYRGSDPASRRVNTRSNTHRGRPHFANPGFLGDGSDLIDERIRIFEFFPAGFEDRALRRRLELVRPRLAHGFGATRS